MSPFQFGTAHPRSNPFDDEIFSKFRDCPDDNDHRPTEWASSVDIFAETDEFDSEVIELIKDLKKMTDGARHAIKCPNEHVSDPCP